MEDYQDILHKIKDEHVNIRENLKLVGDSISDQEAMNTLRATRADWIPGRPDIFSEKQKRLQKTLSFLHDGLRNHFSLEANHLISILDEPFMRAILLEHHDIVKQLDEAISLAADMKPDGLSYEEMVSREEEIQKTISRLLRAVEEHAVREEILLGMMDKGLKDRRKECGNADSSVCT